MQIDEKMHKFLTALALHCGIESVSFTIQHFYEIGLDFGFLDGATKKTFLILLGKLQAALIKASNDPGYAYKTETAPITEAEIDELTIPM